MAAKRIFTNVLFSYGRTLTAAVLTLLSSRWVLAALGASDFGLYGLVGGLLIMVTFINAILSQGVSRFLAYAIGENVEGGVKEWFNAALNIFVLLPVVILPLGWGIGIYFINHVLDIPPDRIASAVWVLRFSLVTVFFSMISMPFLGILTAFQFIHYTSMIALLHSFGQFVIALIIGRLPGNLLIWYAALVAASFCLMSMAYMIVAYLACPDARLSLRIWWRKDKLKKLLSYSSLLVVGTSGTVIRGQCVNIALNRFAGTVANAGYTVANNLSGQMQTLSNSFLLAVIPEVTRRAGTGNQAQMLAMAQRASKLGMLLILVVALPLFFECETVLRLWLAKPPPYAVPFAKIVIVSTVLYKLAVGHRMAFQACGKILGLQITEFVCYSLTAVGVWIAIKLTGSVIVGMIPFAIFQGIYVIVLAIIGQSMFSWEAKDFLVQLAMPSAVCFAAGWIVFGGVESLLSPGLPRIGVTTIGMIGLIVGVFWCAILDQSDRRLCRTSWCQLAGRARIMLGMRKGM